MLDPYVQESPNGENHEVLTTRRGARRASEAQ